ncbi:hypothetical protein EV361DRAFT_947315 [Lentinula raphanica]|uniref:SH3 domain-containing protein n=1 Tax=Lentinula raphanica TaxID=153919 RepID=A0AA38UFK8_9AGAR|nr:hypothetical protein FB446DRAFT_783721 [Lentinula raphanica]KAJ3839982.1 hypothetical protein F5878DRAFT_659815 [Lentinula raphanica]KAJ3974093.1 hypothetical protein EV361DRAFT_947315 [Lentinula raphanica]
MSPGHLGRRTSAFRVIKRSPQTAVADTTSVSVTTPTATETSNAYAQQIVNSVPHSTIALAVVLSAFAAILLGVCAWKYTNRRRRRRNQAADSEDPLYRAASNTSFNSEKQTDGLEKPKQAFIPIPHKGEAAWTPQVRTYLGVPLKNGELPKHVQAAREGRSWRNNTPSPPPSYEEKADPFHSDPLTASKGPTNKPLNIVTNSSYLPNPPPLTTVTEESSQPLPSPIRTTSFAHQHKHTHSRSRSVSSKHLSGETVTKVTPAQARRSRGGSVSEKIRLMYVINTFHPSLDDELPIRIGDCVRLIEEYHDGWCLVQHVSNVDSQHGVVPRFCLVDRQSAPAKSRKRSLTQSVVKA